MLLIGLGATVTLLPWRVALIGFGLFIFGILSGSHGIDALIAPLVHIPGGAQYRMLGALVSPVAFRATGMALLSPAPARPYRVPSGALVGGAAFGSFVRLTYPIFGDHNVLGAGLVFGIWICAAAALNLRAFRQPWFAIAGPIVGSWFVGIVFLDGGSILLK